MRALLRQAADDGIGQFRVGALIVREGRVLLLRRAPHETFPGIFELPSGGVEPGEAILDALAREVWEETGLRVRVVTVYAGRFDYTTRAGQRARQLNFGVEVDGEEPRIDPAEHDHLAWVAIDQIATSGVTDAVRAIVEGYAGGGR